jgi:DNA-binding transcriptional LysR family regulator
MWISPELAETVATIVDEGSFEQAARRLRISPSAVSQRLRTLESQLGRVLIIRSRPIRATADGGAIVRLARQYAAVSHEAGVSLGLERQERMHVPIAVNADSLATWLLPALEAVTHDHDVTFELLREDEARTALLLESGSALAAITSEKRPIAGCSVTALGSTEYIAVATPAFVARWFPQGITREALAAAPAIEFDRTMCRRIGCGRSGRIRRSRPGTMCRHRRITRRRCGSAWAGECCRRRRRRHHSSGALSHASGGATCASPCTGNSGTSTRQCCTRYSIRS